METPSEAGAASRTGEPKEVRQTAYEYVHSVLRSAILKGELAGGTRLVQAEVGAMLDVSTTPVREALRDLATEGLVRFDPHRGAIVEELSSDDIHDIYKIRHVIEPEALRQVVPRLSEATLAALRKLYESMLEDQEAADWVDRNRDFHMAAYEAASSPRLATIIRSLQDASIMHVGTVIHENPDRRAEANTGHAEILEAIETGDADAAARALRHHLQASIDAFDATRDGD